MHADYTLATDDVDAREDTGNVLAWVPTSQNTKTDFGAPT